MTNPVYVLANSLRSISWCHCFCGSVVTRPYLRELIAGYFFLFVSVECFYLSQWTARFLCPWCGEIWSLDVISFHKAFVFNLNVSYCKKFCVNGLGTRYDNKIRHLPPYITTNSITYSTLTPPPCKIGMSRYLWNLRNYNIEKLFPNRDILWTRKKKRNDECLLPFKKWRTHR